MNDDYFEERRISNACLRADREIGTRALWTERTTTVFFGALGWSWALDMFFTIPPLRGCRTDVLSSTWLV